MDESSLETATTTLSGSVSATSSHLISDWFVQVWNAELQEQCRLEGHTDTVFSVLAMADGRIVSGSWDTTIKVRDQHRPLDAVFVGVGVSALMS